MHFMITNIDVATHWHIEICTNGQHFADDIFKCILLSDIFVFGSNFTAFASDSPID